MAHRLFVGTVEEFVERKEEFAGKRLEVFETMDDRSTEGPSTPPHTIRDAAHLEELLLAGIASPKEEVTEQEWVDLRREVRDLLAARTNGDE